MSYLKNLILNTDSYKASHFLQYPPDSQQISCYIESRGGAFSRLLFFGLQMYLKEYLSQPITMDDINEAESFFIGHGLIFNRAGWEYILREHQGYMPIEIEAIAEGQVLPLHHVLAQVVNTDPRCYWLPTYLETSLLRAVWYPTTVATISWHCKEIIYRYLKETADDTSSVVYKLHDFGARGTSSQESAAIGGAAHLVNFKGTDTVAGVEAVRRYYHESIAGHSIPAAEHSTIVCWGRENEAEAYGNILRQFGGPGKIVAVVSDSYDLWHALEKIWGGQLKEQVISQGGTIVIRPDSGNPAEIVTKSLDILMTKFGYETNSKGYKLLPKYLRLIQGDSVNLVTIEECLSSMKKLGQSAENIAFGMGGALLQKLNRDTLEFAMKANGIKRHDEWIDVYKDPVTGHKKRSKRGRLALIREGRDFKTVQISELGDRENLLQPVFRNGKLLRDWKFAEIREKCHQTIETSF